MGVAEAHAEQAALGERVERADDVVAGAVAALPVVPRIEEHHTVGTIAGAEHSDEAAHESGYEQCRDSPPTHPAHPEHRENTHEADGRGAQIGLGSVHKSYGQDDEQKRADHSGAKINRPALVVH